LISRNDKGLNRQRALAMRFNYCRSDFLDTGAQPRSPFHGRAGLPAKAPSRVMDIAADHQHALWRLSCPFPAQIKRVPAVHHISLFNFRFPQCLSLRDGSNTRSTWRFNARMTPIRANMVGPGGHGISKRAECALVKVKPGRPSLSPSLQGRGTPPACPHEMRVDIDIGRGALSPVG
jgi:hypothetical protein